MNPNPFLSAVALASLAGLAAAKGPEKLESRDGDVLWRQWNVPSPDRLFVGTRGSPATQDLTPTFIPCGTDPEADSHSAVSYLPDGSAIVLANQIGRASCRERV